MEKKTRDDPTAATQSKAAKFNVHTLKKLRAAVDDDPEVDLATKLPIDYSARLEEMRESSQSQQTQNACVCKSTTEPRKEDIRESLSLCDPVNLLFPLSDTAQRRLEEISTTAAPLPSGLSRRIYETMQASEVLWAAPFPRQKMVFKFTDGIVVKAIRRRGHDYTEYTTLQYLQQHRPSIPAPRPLGLVQVSGILLIFMTHMPSTTLGEVWHRLDENQKISIKEQLDRIFTDLRSIPYYPGSPLGGVGGEGCKDIRRHLRRSEKPITTIEEFEDFLYSSPRRPGGQVFLDLLHQLSPSLDSFSSLNIVFTHGDLRPDNIVVDIVDNRQYIVSGLLDWEYSGFYPEYYEAIRCTNCLAPYEEDDWYLYLPHRISPRRYGHWWLLDRVREARVL